MIEVCLKCGNPIYANYSRDADKPPKIVSYTCKICNNTWTPDKHVDILKDIIRRLNALENK